MSSTNPTRTIDLSVAYAIASELNRTPFYGVGDIIRVLFAYLITIEEMVNEDLAFQASLTRRDSAYEVLLYELDSEGQEFLKALYREFCNFHQDPVADLIHERYEREEQMMIELDVAKFSENEDWARQLFIEALGR